MVSKADLKIKPMSAFDFFCGAGGLTRGLLDAGIRVIAGFDSDGKCKQSYESNNPGAMFVEAKIHKITLKDLKTYARGEPLNKMLFAACAPCQPFSKQIGHGENRYQAALLGEFGRLIEEALPGQILMENVPGIARIKGNSTFRRFLRMLERNGYQYEYGTLDAKRYGVPQNRRRIILIAMEGIKPTLPKPTHGPGYLPYGTVRNAISHFPPLKAGGADPEIPNHSAALITAINLERLRYTPRNGGDRRSWPKRLKLACHIGDYQGHTDVYGRMSWDAPAPTLTGRCISISNGRYGHPTQNRAISLREAAALQSFPDGYVFSGTRNHMALQIGNAVPVRLAEALGKQILILRNESR
jgi:DNA (cytosine-5)-methyltransferase 1